MKDIVVYDSLIRHLRKNPQTYAQACENNFFDFLEQLAKRVVSEGIKTVYICGQSASGKTTTTLRLKTNLETLGKKVHIVELDDFFLPQAKQKKNKKGELDFETIFALDLPAIYEFKKNISLGKTVLMPDFDFMAGDPGETKNVLIQPDDILIVEGIHSFNQRILNTFGLEHSLKVFISVYSDLLIGDTRLTNNDLRFCRRLVRDYYYRNAHPDWTADLWKMVRAGEKRYVDRYKQQADVFFNTFLNYEPFVLKEEAISLLEKGIASGRKLRYYRIIQNKLRKLETISGITVSKDSILQEFIKQNS